MRLGATISRGSEGERVLNFLKSFRTVEILDITDERIDIKAPEMLLDQLDRTSIIQIKEGEY